MNVPYRQNRQRLKTGVTPKKPKVVWTGFIKDGILRGLLIEKGPRAPEGFPRNVFQENSSKNTLG